MGNIFIKNTEFNENLDIPKKYNSKYWYYCGILIPYNIKNVPSIDKVNSIGLDCSTEVYSDCVHWTPKEYQEKYGILKSDGKIYWKKQ